MPDDSSILVQTKPGLNPLGNLINREYQTKARVSFCYADHCCRPFKVPTTRAVASLLPFAKNDMEIICSILQNWQVTGKLFFFSIMYDLSMECYAPNTICKVGWLYLHCVYTVEYVPGHKYTPIFTYVNQMTFRSCYPLLLRAYNMRYKIIITRLAISLGLKKIIAFSICSEIP